MVSMGVVALMTWAGTSGAQGLSIENWKLLQPGFPHLTAEFDVRAGSGELVDSLTDQKVVVTEEGRTSSTQLRSGPPDDGVAYILALDTSGSMANVLPALRRQLALWVRGLASLDRVGVVTFDDTDRILAGLSLDHEGIATALLQLQATGHTTELYFGVYRALQQFQVAGLPQRKVLIVISDGRNRGRAYSLEDCIKRATDEGVNIVSIGVASGASSAVLNMQKMAEMTGGLFTHFDPSQEPAPKVDMIQRYVNARYRLAWTSELAPDGKTHNAELRITVGDTSVAKAFEVKTPFVAPPPPPPPPFPWLVAILVIAGAAVIAVIVALVVMHGRRTRHRLDEVKQALEKTQTEAAVTQAEVREATATIAAQQDELAKAVKGAAAQPAPVPPPSPAKPQRRATVFSPGGGPPSYRSALLEVLVGPAQGSRLPLPDGDTKLGREDDNSIVLDEDRVSRYHAVISRRDGITWIRDAGSANGTFVDEERVTGNAIGLRSGQRVRLGGVVLLFHGES